MKDNFLLKKSHKEIFNELSDEDSGKLIKGIFNYVCDGDSKLTGLLNVVFIPIKKEIDKNEEKYKTICERNKKMVQMVGDLKKMKMRKTKKNRKKPKKTQWVILGKILIYHISLIIYQIIIIII